MKSKKGKIEGAPWKFRKIALDAVSEYRWQLGMQSWQVDIDYAVKDKKPDPEGGLVAASIDVNRRYIEATITIYPMLVERWKDKRYSENKVREVIAHEVSHIATQHFLDVAMARYCDDGEMKDAWETCTTVIGRLIHKLAKKK